MPLKIADSQVPNLHRAFDLVFKQLSSLDSLAEHIHMIKNGATTAGPKLQPSRTTKSTTSNINMDLHVSSQMILLYPDIDSENLIKEAVGLFNRAVQKHSKYFNISSSRASFQSK